MQTVPWAFALVTAVWFGMKARAAGRNWLGWALGGGVFALTATTFVLGVSQAAFIPLSQTAVVWFRIKSVAAAALMVGAVGCFLTRTHRAPPS